MQESEPGITAILNALHDYQVEFIIVGGVCAVLHGTPVTTFDLDVVHSGSPENISRVLCVLEYLDAHYRGHPKKIRPDAESLGSQGHHLLITRFGPLDILGTIENGLGYTDLIGHTEDIQIENRTFRVLSLEYFIEIKEKSLFEKDRLRMSALKHTLNEREKIRKNEADQTV
ncbi:hypothetical protein QUF80_11470 [Desulfococcaceae bacterium HSG8]|nr:hypothetical protein [Desulfococcaceae bacterium HSG8]